MNNNNSATKKKVKQNQARQKTARQKTVAKVRSQPQVQSNWSPLSPAATAYARALTNPFDAEVCGVPNIPAILTKKLKVWSKGTFTTSTAAAANGVSWITVNPFAAAANDQEWVKTNSPASPIPSIDVVTAANYTAYNSNSEFAAASFGVVSAQKRVVATGLKIKNLTPDINIGGKTIGLLEPTHGSLHGFAETGMNAFVESEIHTGRDLKKPLVLLWYTSDTNDTNMTSSFPADNAQNGACMGFIVVAPPANPQTYEFEAYAIVEIQGVNVTGKDLSIADSTGFEAVQNTMTSSHKLHKPHVQDSRIGDHAVVAANHMVVTQQSSRAAPPTKPKAPPQQKNLLGDVLGIAAPLITGIANWLF